MKGMSHAAPSLMADGSVVLASGSDGGIQQLKPVPFQQQAASLADAEEFQEALQLASYIPDSEVEYSFHMQNNRQFLWSTRMPERNSLLVNGHM